MQHRYTLLKHTQSNRERKRKRDECVARTEALEKKIAVLTSSQQSQNTSSSAENQKSVTEANPKPHSGPAAGNQQVTNFLVSSQQMPIVLNSDNEQCTQASPLQPHTLRLGNGC